MRNTKCFFHNVLPSQPPRASHFPINILQNAADLPCCEKGDGGVDPAWQNAYARARDLVSQMTIDEKVNMTNGHEGDCVGNTPSIERLGIPQLWCVVTSLTTTR